MFSANYDLRKGLCHPILQRILDFIAENNPQLLKRTVYKKLLSEILKSFL